MDRQPRINGIKEAMKIASWNCNGVRRRKDELRIFMEEEDLAVVMLQETHLKPGDQIAFPGYQMFRKDREGAPGGEWQYWYITKSAHRLGGWKQRWKPLGPKSRTKMAK